MRKIILTVALASIAFAASAQSHMSPIGKWKANDHNRGL
jgi:hypothetical protein